MQTIQLSERTGADGTLTLRVPVGRPDTEVAVVVVVQPKGPAVGGWPPGYFDLFGSVTDDTFVVHPQPGSGPAGPDWRSAADAIREQLRATGRNFSDSTELIREDRDR